MDVRGREQRVCLAQGWGPTLGPNSPLPSLLFWSPRPGVGGGSNLDCKGKEGHHHPTNTVRLSLLSLFFSACAREKKHPPPSPPGKTLSLCLCSLCSLLSVCAGDFACVLGFDGVFWCPAVVMVGDPVLWRGARARGERRQAERRNGSEKTARGARSAGRRVCGGR